MPLIDLLLVIFLGTLAGVLLRSRFENQQQQLDDAFYQLLESEDSCIALIQLSALARIDAQLAQQYLERQVKLFNAIPEVDADGDTFYRFPKLHRRQGEA